MPSTVCEDSARLSCMYIITNLNIMAKNVINEKGFKVIALTPKECGLIGFGIIYDLFYELICDSCNELLNEHKEVYYIPVLNRVFCKDCFVKWYESAKVYPENKRYETQYYDYVVSNITNKGCEFTEDINFNDICNG